MSSTPFQTPTPSAAQRPAPYYATTSHVSPPQPRHRPSPTPSFTPAMRDRQARGKDPFSPSAGDAFASPGGAQPDPDADAADDMAFLGGGGERERGESFEARRRREWARDVLESPEMLMWYASSREDSIPGTRLFFTRVLCGFEDDDDVPPPEATQRKTSGSGSRSHGQKRR